MPRAAVTILPVCLRLLAGLLILKVTLSVVLEYGAYFPPQFTNGFLQGRQHYFFGPYQWAFYAHLLSGPVTLIFGLVLLSEKFRRFAPRGHRTLGKAQIALIVCILCPSGLWMAYYAETGAVAAIGFSTLAVATATCAILGWRAAVSQQFAEHRIWMNRCFLLLCSAIVLRLIGGAATVLAFSSSWSYPLAAWASWLVPLVAWESYQAYRLHRYTFALTGRSKLERNTIRV